MRRLLLIAALASACSANDSIPAPQVAAVQPDTASVGSLVTITGAYFCQRPDLGGEVDPGPCAVVDGLVHFAAIPATPTVWTDTSIQVEVPQGAAGTLDVSISVAGRTSNAVPFVTQ